MNEEKSGDEIIFKNKVLLNNVFYEEINEYLMPKRNKIIALFCMGFIGIITLLLINLKNKFIFVFGCVVIALLSFLYYSIAKKTKRISYQDITEDKYDVFIETIFYEDKINMNCNLFEKEQLIDYKEIYRIDKSKNYLLLFVLNKPLIFVARKELTNEDEFLDYLEKHKSKLVLNSKARTIGIIIAVFIVLCLSALQIIWSQYEEPEIKGSEVIINESDQATIEKVTEKWFQEWVEGHEGWKVPFSYRLKNAEITSIDMLETGYVEVHYRTTIYGWNGKVIHNMGLISTDIKNEYDGQWVLKWQEDGSTWKIEEVMSPVQYQIQTPEFAEERNQPQTTHFAYDKEKEMSYYVKDETLYVTYDKGETFTEVPDGYEPVCKTVNDTYDEYLPDGSYVVTEDFTAFIGYENSQTILIYSIDKGNNWSQSVIYDGGYRANSFISKTENYCYVTFAVDRTGGSDYYCTFRSPELENWETVSLPTELYSNANCVFWKDDNVGYYGSGNSFYLTEDGGSSYELHALPLNEEIIAEQGFNPYDTLENMYIKNGIVYMLIGQGDDGDYTKDGKLLKALYQSGDGIKFSFVEEKMEGVEEAG